MTSWECYNIVLKGLVEQLMELGASPRLKVTVFQLWALYLKTAKVAFVSETEEKFPSLPLGFKIKLVFFCFFFFTLTINSKHTFKLI